MVRSSGSQYAAAGRSPPGPPFQYCSARNLCTAIWHDICPAFMLSCKIVWKAWRHRWPNHADDRCCPVTLKAWITSTR